jgi:hypothetical protein
MAVNCRQSISELIVKTKHVEWMSKIHNEPITKIPIPGKERICLR